MAERTAVCQFTSARRCGVRQAMILHFWSTSGFEWYEGACQSHAEQRSNQVRAEKGELVGVEVLPVPSNSPLVMVESPTAQAKEA